MLARTAAAALAFVAMPFVACGGPTSRASSDDDAGATFTVPRDASVEAVAPTDARTPWARLEAHQHRVLSNMRLTVVYISEDGDGALSFDTFLDWLLTSDYWGIMKQYGVNRASRVTSIRLARANVLPAGVVTSGLITAEDLELAVHAAIHPDVPDGGALTDSGTDSGSDSGSDSGADSGPETDSGPPPPPTIALADAYLFFLPIGVNVNLGQRGQHVFQTCIDAGGYHAFDGDEPYAIIPPCPLGRSPLAISHELAEMATDPFPGSGWFSSKDVDNAGGEIGDLCNQIAPHGADGWDVTQLWSNADGDCEPN